MGTTAGPLPFINKYSVEFGGVVGQYAVDTGVTNTTMGIGGQISVSFWVKANGTVGGFQTMLGNFSTYPASGNQGFVFYFLSDKMSFGIDGYTGWGVTSEDCTLNDGTWFHCVGIYDKDKTVPVNQQVMLWINGAVPTSPGIGAQGDVGGTEPFYIGKAATTQTGYYAPIIIDEVSIWNVVLTPSEVAEIYNEGTPTDLADFSGTPPKAWYRMGDGDIYPNLTNHGSVSGTFAEMISMASGDIIEDVP